MAFFILRNKASSSESPQFFAGFKPSSDKAWKVVPTFVHADRGNPSAMIIDEVQIADTEADLAKLGIETVRIEIA